MTDFNNKNIILGICGGIAAYKSAELVRLLIKQGAQIQVVMTDSAREFVTPLTFQALSGKSVRSKLFDVDAEAGMGHIELARWADLIIIAPATANSIAKIAYGMADDLLSTLCLATKAPLLLAPAMNHQMWKHEATQTNIKLLSQRQKVSFCGPANGDQACGDIGPGRMEEPQALLECCARLLLKPVKHDFSNVGLLKDKKVLITAGPTIEDIDPVRFLSNRSSGKMGFATAQAALEQGAEVFLVCGPVSLKAPENVKLFSVRSALQMHEKVMQLVNKVDIFIATAAVADYRPVQKKPQKIKKEANSLSIDLVKNPDILSAVAALSDKPLSVGFAAETNDISDYAMGKLERKNLDMIAANKVGKAQGFEVDYNELQLFWPQDSEKKPRIATKTLAYASKQIIAQQLIAEIAALLATRMKKGK